MSDASPAPSSGELEPDPPPRRRRPRRPRPPPPPLSVAGPPPRPGLTHFIESWRIPLLAAVAVLLVAGTRFEETRPLVATVIAIALPVITVAAGAFPLRDSSPGLRRGAFLIGLLVLAGSETCVVRSFYPPAPFDEATLSDKQPDATLDLPDGAHQVEVESRVTMGHVHGTAEGRYTLELERAGKKQSVQGSFSRSGAGGARRGSRRAPQATQAHTDDVDLQAVDLPGSGPLHAHLMNLSGAVAHTLRVSVGPPFAAAMPLAIALVVLGFVGVGVEAIAMNRGLRSHFSAYVGMAIALAVYMPQHFDPGDPFGAVLGALVIAVLAGGGMGFLLGLMSAKLLDRG